MPYVIRRSYKFRLYPTRSQERVFRQTLGICRELYNAGLQERRDAWRMRGASVSYYDQQGQLKYIRTDREDVAAPYAKVLEDVLRRVDLAFQAFFRRVKRGEKPGYPRFRGARRYASFTYTSGQGFRVGRKLRLGKIGAVLWRPYTTLPEGCVVKTVAIRREPDGWYAVLSCTEPQPEPLPKTGRVVGVDLGLRALVATSDGKIIQAARTFEKKMRGLCLAHRRVSRRKKGSHRRRKAVQMLARSHQHVARSRKHFLDNVSRQLVEEHDMVAMEDLAVGALGRSGAPGNRGRSLRRSFKDAAWGGLIWMLTYKAEWAGRRLIRVDPRGTSQQCSQCGLVVPKDLSVRTHRCPDCGLVLDRDVNAARNVLQRALRVLRGEEGLPSSGKREGRPSRSDATPCVGPQPA